MAGVGRHEAMLPVIVSRAIFEEEIRKSFQEKKTVFTARCVKKGRVKWNWPFLPRAMARTVFTEA